MRLVEGDITEQMYRCVWTCRR